MHTKVALVEKAVNPELLLNPPSHPSISIGVLNMQSGQQSGAQISEFHMSRENVELLMTGAHRWAHYQSVPGKFISDTGVLVAPHFVTRKPVLLPSQQALSDLLARNKDAE